MNRTNKRILIILAVLALIAAMLLLYRHRTTTLDKKYSTFQVQDTATVTRVFLADKKNRSLLLERMPDGRWMVNKTYLARKSGIDLLLETLKNLRTRYPVPEKAHNSVISQLAAQSTKVEVYQQVYRIDLFGKIKLFPHEKKTKTFYVGSATADNQGNFMLMEGADKAYVVHLLGFRGFVSPRFSVFAKDWRDHQVFKTKIYQIDEVTVEIPREPQESFKVKNNGDNFELYRLTDNSRVDGYDTLRMLNFLTAFNDLRYEALLDDIDSLKRDSIINSVPKDIISLVDKNGDTTRIKTFYKANDNQQVDLEGNLYVYDVDRLYALVNDDRDFVLIQYYVFDKILRPLSYFSSR
ncbi:MAG: hypothetical protein Kow00127_19020 [Bacteroidales bacterium]